MAGCACDCVLGREKKGGDDRLGGEGEGNFGDFGTWLLRMIVGAHEGGLYWFGDVLCMI